MITPNQFYNYEVFEGMKLRSGKRLNFMGTTEIIRDINNLYDNISNRKHYTESKYFEAKKQICLRCSFMEDMITLVNKHYKPLSEEITLIHLKKTILQKIKIWIKTLEFERSTDDSTYNYRFTQCNIINWVPCDCWIYGKKDYNEYIKELKNIHKFLITPQKPYIDLYFKLASRLNKDIANIIVKKLM